MILSSLQIHCICTNHYHTTPFYSGVFSIDNLPIKVQSYPSFYICDVVSRKHDQNVIGHWVLILFPNHNSPPEFFDPLGHPPTHYGQNLGHFLIDNSSHSTYKFNNVQVQSQHSVSCGAFCLYVADQRILGRSLPQAVRSLHTVNLAANDELVQNYVIHHMTKPESTCINDFSRKKKNRAGRW